MRPKPGRHKHTTRLEDDLISWLHQETARRKIAAWSPGGDPEQRATTEADVINDAIRKLRAESQK